MYPNQFIFQCRFYEECKKVYVQTAKDNVFDYM